METLRFLLRATGALSLVLASLGLLGTACNGAFIATIHRALSEHALDRTIVLGFFGFGAGRIVAAFLSMVLLGDHTARAVTALRAEIVARLLSVPYRLIERVGTARVLSTLTQDMSILESTLAAVPGAVTSGAMLLGGTAYLLCMSPTLFGAIALLVVVCWFVFLSASRRAHAQYLRQRAAHERLWDLCTALTHGIKELKSHAARRASFLNGPLQETSRALLEHDVAVRRSYAMSGAVNHGLVMIVLAAVLFVLPTQSAVRSQVASGYVLVGLYLISPLAALSRMWPLFRAAEVSLACLRQLGVQLANAPDEAGASADVRPSAATIELVSVQYGYDDERRFALGPISLRLVPGEIVFLTGGNGSGKTTLGRLITGLYAPQDGELRWDGRRVASDKVDIYRQLWSVVFSDAYVFDRLYGIEPQQIERRAAALIDKLGLRGVVSVRNGAFSSIDLSSGQRKRLSLLVALLEDRPFCLFDEWAAEQDPGAKHAFYRDVLPDLRARGKGVVVITHDDRYFDAADRVLILRDGQVDA